MATAIVNAGQACIRSLTVVEPSTGIVEAARLMRQRHVGCLIVTRDAVPGRMPVGMLTDRDIVTAIVARDVAAGTLRVEDAMTTPLVTAQQGDGLPDVLRLMRRRGVRRVVVVDSQGALVGLIALDDVMEIVAEQLHELTGVLRRGRLREEGSRP